MCPRFKTEWPEYLVAFFLLIAAASWLPASNLHAQSQSSLVVPFKIEIGQVYENAPGDTVSLQVKKSAGSENFQGFEFLIGFDTSFLSLVGVDPGEPYNIPGPYEWEYFAYRTGASGLSGDTMPSGIARFISLSDINNGAHHPLLEQIPDGTVLFSIRFSVHHDTTYKCSAAPVRFFWMDCGDNAIAYPVGPVQTLALSDSVIDFQGIDITKLFRPMPSYYGAPQQCIDSLAPNPPVRFASFVNGKVDFYCYPGAPPMLGDLNCNGIQYEIADAATFKDYLLQGLSAFPYPDCSIPNSDTKKDDSLLTVEDYAYLIRVINGTLHQFPDYVPMTFEQSNGLLALITTDSSMIIRTDFHDSVSALYLKFYAPDLHSASDYSIRVFPGVDSLLVSSNIKDDTLRILVADSAMGSSAVIDSGITDILDVVYAGAAPVLSHYSASGFYGQHVNLALGAIPNHPPVFNNVPTELTNTCYGGFQHIFTAHDPDFPPDNIEYHIISGPGEINPATGEWTYVPICLDTGTTLNLVLCASDVAHPCPQPDSALYAYVLIVVDSLPPVMGDANNSGGINVLDLSREINYLYKSGPPPIPVVAVADVNGDHKVDVLDIAYTVEYLYRAGPKPTCQ